MAEYIELKAALNAITDLAGKASTCSAYETAWKSARALKKIPVADVAPVVHGRWMKHYRSGVTVAEGCVSSCCDMWNERQTHYRPHCGAKMDGGDSDESD